MKKIVKIVVALLAVTNCQSKMQGQCPVPGSCTYTAASGTNYTVNSGQVLCINSGVNYNSGTITLNGGTIYVASGGTLSRDLAPSGASTVNVCGTVSSGMRVNNNTTINYYGTSSVSIDFTNGGQVNNYSNNINFSIGNMNTNGASFTNYATGVNLSIGNWNNAFTLKNTAGASMTVTSSPTIVSNSTIVNDGTLTWQPQLVINSGATFTNNGNFSATGSAANFNGATFNNNGTSTFANGPVFQNSSTVNNNAGSTFTVTTGKLDVTGSTTFNNGGALNIKDAIFQGSSTFNNLSTGTVIQSSGLLDINGGTVNNSGTFEPYNLKLSSGGFNMNPGGVLQIDNQIQVLDMSINTSSGCSYINLGAALDMSVAPNQNLTTGAGTTNICGKVPYKNTDANNITAATNDNPIKITMATNTNNHIANGVKIFIEGVTGNAAANGLWTVANYNAATKTFELVGSDGTTSGTYSGGGQVYYDLKAGSNVSYAGYSNCSNPCVSLPIVLVSFSAQPQGEKIKLSWTTASEENNNYFVLERSADGIHYEALQTINGNLHSSALLYYTAYDNEPLEGISYYRLKQVDLDGRYSYSKSEGVNFISENGWKVFPNPSFDGSFVIQSDFEVGKNILITVTDVAGFTVKKYDAASYKNELAVSGLAKGLYIVILQNEAQTTSKKMLVQ